ncbi:hypothetical protein [Microcystis aeruginosa]|uniref:hypothetical protein n=1 Tax=Microcystis aeruginosa TaxID=1126 RepID=UPI00188249B0|nr:hypothetical protein [Microcystis aeruginosa]MBE8994286.1 hypothetical protein [Microcystis aeruginosa LEGE 91341]
MTIQQYSLTIKNLSGADQDVALFQVDDPGSGYPLVWLSQKILSGNNYTFTWCTKWYLGFGSTSEPLKPGVAYVSQNQIEVKPNDANGSNEIQIQYDDRSFKFSSSSPYNNDKIDNGVMQIITDTSFTVEQSSLMSVALYMNDKPILASQGKPGTQYQFYTNTIYYLTVTDIPEGSVLPSFTPKGSVLPSFTPSNSSIMMECAKPTTIAISQPTQVNFPAGQTALTYNLTNVLMFELVQD